MALSVVIEDGKIDKGYSIEGLLLALGASIAGPTDSSLRIDWGELGVVERGRDADGMYTLSHESRMMKNWSPFTGARNSILLRKIGQYDWQAGA